MRSHTVPFENRWTNGEHAWQWHCELEPSIIFDIPPGFVRDWLAFHDRRAVRQQFVWRASVIVLGLAAVSGVVLAAWR
jgi:hypothetical protein